MRDYQAKKNTKYKLPQAVYHATVWKIRDYYRLKEVVNDLIEIKSGDSDGIRGSDIIDKVANTAAKREKFLEDINRIDCSLKEIPNEYQQGVWNNIQFRQPYPLDADRSTYGRYKSKFIYRLAERLGLI